MLDKISGYPNLLGSPVISPTHMKTSLKWLDMFQLNDRLAHATLMIDTVLERPGSVPYMKLFSEADRRKIQSDREISLYGLQAGIGCAKTDDQCGCLAGAWEGAAAELRNKGGHKKLGADPKGRG